MSGLAGAIRKLGRSNGVSAPPKKKPLKLKTGPSRKELKEVIGAMRSAKSDDDALEAFLTLSTMAKDFDPGEE